MNASCCATAAVGVAERVSPETETTNARVAKPLNVFSTLNVDMRFSGKSGLSAKNAL